MLLLFILNLLYSLIFILGKVVLRSAQPIFFTGIRMFGSGFLSLLVYSAQGFTWKDIKSITFQEWMIIGFMAFTNIYITNACEFWGLQYLPAGKAAFIYNLAPFFAALISYFLFSEIMTKQKWLGLSIGLIGCLPILMGPADIADTTTTFGFLSLAEIALFVSALATAFGWASMRLLVKHRELPTFFLNGISMTLGSMFCFIQSAFFETRPWIAQGTMIHVAWFALAIILIQLIGYNLHSNLLKKYTTTFLFFAGFTCPLFSAVLGWFFLHEEISIGFAISAVAVFIGLYIFYREELRQGYIVKS